MCFLLHKPNADLSKTHNYCIWISRLRHCMLLVGILISWLSVSNSCNYKCNYFEVGLIGSWRGLKLGPFDLESPTLPSELPCFSWKGSLLLNFFDFFQDMLMRMLTLERKWPTKRETISCLSFSMPTGWVNFYTFYFNRVSQYKSFGIQGESISKHFNVTGWFNIKILVLSPIYNLQNTSTY